MIKRDTGTEEKYKKHHFGKEVERTSCLKNHFMVSTINRSNG